MTPREEDYQGGEAGLEGFVCLLLRGVFVCIGCNKLADLKDGLCPICAKARIRATKDASPRVKEYYETVETAAVIAQRVADRAKMLDLPEPQHRHIAALKAAMRKLREAENQLRIAGESR